MNLGHSFATHEHPVAQRSMLWTDFVNSALRGGKEAAYAECYADHMLAAWERRFAQQLEAETRACQERAEQEMRELGVGGGPYGVARGTPMRRPGYLTPVQGGGDAGGDHDPEAGA